MPTIYKPRTEGDSFDPVAHAKEHYPDDPAKFLARYYDRRVMSKGGESIFERKRP